MPIRWSPQAVSQAMDEVEKLLDQAQVYLNEVKKRVEQARKIPNLPGYMDQRLAYLIIDIERMERVKGAIDSVRKDIPEQSLGQPASRSLFD